MPLRRSLLASLCRSDDLESDAMVFFIAEILFLTDLIPYSCGVMRKAPTNAAVSPARRSSAFVHTEDADTKPLKHYHSTRTST